MITKTFAAPIGAGIRKLVVAPAALGMGSRITVITPNNVVFNTNWSRILPNATGIGPLQWLRRAADADTDLIIVDCIHSTMMDRIRATLNSIRAEVWVIANGDEDLAPLHKPATEVTYIKHLRAPGVAVYRAPSLSAIMPISAFELDALLAPHMAAGQLRTAYRAGATEYRSQVGRLIAVSVRGKHFTHTPDLASAWSLKRMSERTGCIMAGFLK